MVKRLLINLLVLCSGIAHTQTSNFNLNAEGWTVVGDGGGTILPQYNLTGGNPGGFISSRDEGTGKTWYFAAPAKFLGNKSWFYGRNLKFDLKQNRTDQQFNDDDIIIEGNGVKLMFDTPNNPGLTWTSYSVKLDETANWRVKRGLFFFRASQAEIKTVLCNMGRLWIRGEYVDGGDEGGMDNAIIDGTDCTPSVTTKNQTICRGQNFTLNGKIYSTTGTYRDTIKYCNPLCDSIFVVNLTVTDPTSKTQTVRICSGDSLKVGNKFYKTAGNFKDTLKSIGGCDSIVSTTLTVTPLVTTNQAVTICEGDMYKIGDTTYSTKGTYTTKLKNSFGCDSTIVTALTVNPKAIKTINASICPGKGYRLGSKIFTQEGIFSDTIRRRAPLCDSITTVNIKFTPLPEITETITICKSDTIYIRGRLFSNGGTFRDTVRTFSAGCDTVIVTNVRISNLAISLGADRDISKGDSVKLTPSVTGGQNLKWTWTPIRGLSCTACPNPISRPDKSVTYIVEARDTTGNCAVKDNITISVKACDQVFIPDAFSPNNDGTNDMFIAFGASCAKQIKQMSIFSRGGQQIFSKQNVPLNNPNNGWDGSFNNKPLPADVYIYVMEIELGGGEMKIFSGDLTLIR